MFVCDITPNISKNIRRGMVIVLFLLFIADHIFTMKAQKYGYGKEINPILNTIGISLGLWFRYCIIPIVYYYFVNKPNKAGRYILSITILVYMIQLGIHIHLYNTSFHNSLPIFGT